MNKQNLKTKEINSKGITLVALIITIIVLLILAMVSISLIMNGGIIGKSKSGVDQYSNEEIGEQIKLAYTEHQMSQYTDDQITFQQALDKVFGTNEATATPTQTNGEYTVAFADGRAFTFNSTTGVVTPATSSSSGQGSGTGGTSQAISTITSANYGDYIDLGQDVVKTSATTDDWRILYNDTTNKVVYAILADYLPNNNAAVTATGLDTYGTYGVYSITDRATLLAGLNHTTAWNSLIPSTLITSGAIVRGAVTGKILMASYNAKHGTSLNYTEYPTLYSDPANGSGIDSLYMPHTSTNEDCYGYWLASPDADDALAAWYVSPDGGVSCTGYYDPLSGVCPVVSLPSNIQVTNNNGIWSIAQ